MSPINSLYTPDEIAFQLKDSGAKMLITISPFLDRAQRRGREVAGRRDRRAGRRRGARQPAATCSASDAPVGRRWTSTRRTTWSRCPTPAARPACPRASCSPTATWWPTSAQSRPLIDLRATDERIIAVLPFFHIYGLTVLMNQGLQWGGTVVTLPRFDLEQFLRTIQDQKITRAFVAPPIVLALAKHPLVDQYDLSSLRSILSGAAPLDGDAGPGRPGPAAQGRRRPASPSRRATA